MKFKVFIQVDPIFWVALNGENGHDYLFDTKEQAQAYLDCVKDRYKPGTQFKIQIA